MVRLHIILASIFVLLATAPVVHAADVEKHLGGASKLPEAPCPRGDSQTLPKRFFTVCFHREWRIARWVAYHLTAADLEGDVKRTEDFRVEI